MNDLSRAFDEVAAEYQLHLPDKDVLRKRKCRNLSIFLPVRKNKRGITCAGRLFVSALFSFWPFCAKKATRMQ
jgi:hypothetical protein